MTYDFNPAALHPENPAAWCDLCDGLRHFAPPLPPIQEHQTAAGVVTLREGRCRDCGTALYRVGGGRGAEPESAADDAGSRRGRRRSLRCRVSQSLLPGVDGW